MDSCSSSPFKIELTVRALFLSLSDKMTPKQLRSRASVELFVVSLAIKSLATADTINSN
jgi:hypothetical protein